MLDLQSECNLKRSQTITRNIQHKIKNTAIKAIVTKNTLKKPYVINSKKIALATQKTKQNKL